MIIYDPESNTAIRLDDRHIIYNANEKINSGVDNKIISCELSDTDPNHNNLLIAASLFYGREYPRFIDLARPILGKDTIYLKQWEELRTTIKDTDFDRHQQLGRHRVNAMEIVVNHFISDLPKNCRVLKLSAALCVINNLAVPTEQTGKVLTFNLSNNKTKAEQIYMEATRESDPVKINDIATTKYYDRGYIQNWWGRRLYNKDLLPVEQIIPALTNGSGKNIYDWLIYSSVHDAAIFMVGTLNNLLLPHNGYAWLSNDHNLTVLTGDAPIDNDLYRHGLLDLIENNIFTGVN